MNRDADILRIFETADDSLQGVIGYHLYVTAMQKAVAEEKMQEFLPDKAIPHTFSWVRFYEKQDLINAFKTPVFELYQSRISLVAMTNVFEVALDNFISCLEQKGHHQFLDGKKLRQNRSYKECVRWAYLQALKCDIGDKSAIQRLPTTFGIIDNARRLRNLIVHNHGLFDMGYEKEAITSDGIVVELYPDYQIFKEKPQRPTPLVIATEDVIKFSRSHIEALHVLHNHIQKEYCHFSRAYDYREANKRIEWNKVLWGDAKVKILQLAEVSEEELSP